MLHWVCAAAWLSGCAADSGEHVLAPRAAPELHGLGVRSAKPLSLRAERGKCVLLAFGYTRCSDLCPTTLATMSAVLANLGPLAARMQPLYASLDPERDTPEQFRAFLEHVDPRIEGLSLARDELTQIASAYAESVNKRPPTLQRFLVGRAAGEQPRSDYSIVHTGGLWLVDPQGRLRLRYDHEAPATVIAAGAARLLRERAQ